jgi:clan AA aspartic protease
MPSLTAIILRVTVSVITTGLVYLVPILFAGVLPSVVYQISAPPVSQNKAESLLYLEVEIIMGTVYAEITVKNAADLVCAKAGLIKEQEIRSITVTAVVDTGAASLVINEEQCQKLGLGIEKERSVRVADGRKVFSKVTEPVKVEWKDRDASCNVVVIPSAETVLLGAIPLEFMDLMIHPAKQELVGVHGDTIELLAL